VPTQQRSAIAMLGAQRDIVLFSFAVRTAGLRPGVFEFAFQ
jgi:hypothetical protein